TADVLGKDFFDSVHFAVVTDGGSKTRGGPPTNAHHGQFSLAPLFRVIANWVTGGPSRFEVTTFLEMNLHTIGATWLQMKDYGRHTVLWPASDGIIEIGANPGFGSHGFDELPTRFLAASGQKVSLFEKGMAREMKNFATSKDVLLTEL